MTIIDAIIMFGVLLFVATLVGLMSIGCHFDRKLKEKQMEIDKDVKLKAIEALKSNVELKLNTSDLKDLLK